MPYTPGVDEAIMSRYAVLTPAAWQDFAAYVQRLEAGGHHGRARALASSVVEIRHAGHGLPGRVCRGTASLLGAATHPLRAIPGGRVPPFVFPGLGCGVVGGSPSPMERLSPEWLALPATEARPLLIRYDERLNLHQPGPGAPLCVAIGCLERAPYRCRRCRAPLCGDCAARGCGLCGQPGSSHWLRVGHGV